MCLQVQIFGSTYFSNKCRMFVSLFDVSYSLIIFYKSQFIEYAILLLSGTLSKLDLIGALLSVIKIRSKEMRLAVYISLVLLYFIQLEKIKAQVCSHELHGCTLIVVFY
jgi:hypothetical protein